MVLLKLKKRLSASVLNCGRGKVWLDPNETNELSTANSTIQKTCQGWFHHSETNHGPLKVPCTSDERGSGYGKRKATREARLPSKVLSIRRMQILRHDLLGGKKGQQRKKTCQEGRTFCPGLHWRTSRSSTCSSTIREQQEGKVV